MTHECTNCGELVKNDDFDMCYSCYQDAVDNNECLTCGETVEDNSHYYCKSCYLDWKRGH